MAWLKANTATLFMFAVIACLGAAVAFLYHDNGTLQEDNALLRRERDEARFILQNQQRAMTLFNTVSKAVRDEKKHNQQEMDVIRQDVREALANDAPAAALVPQRGADRVRDAARAIRTGAARPHP